MSVDHYDILHSATASTRIDLQFYIFVGPSVEVMAKYFTFFFYSRVKKAISNPSIQVKR